MKQIWKFPFKIGDLQEISMPEGAEILTVQLQVNTPCIWALVDTRMPKVNRMIAIFGTGYTIPENFDMTYIGTYQQAGGALVFHVFEVNHV